MIIFVSGKNRPLLLAKGVHWCLIFMCTLHLWPGTWDTSQRKFKIFHQLSQKLIYLDWLDFYVYVKYIQTYVDHFFILEIQFFCWEKINKLGTSPTRRHVMNCELYQFVIVIDWSMKYDFLSAECRHALNYGHTDLSIASMIGLQLCRPTAWIVSSCFNIHAYSILFYKENAT